MRFSRPRPAPPVPAPPPNPLVAALDAARAELVSQVRGELDRAILRGLAAFIAGAAVMLLAACALVWSDVIP